MLKVTPLAFESLGVRSMATHVEVGDLSIVIDPAVALGPKRFGLSPHPIEEKTKAELWRLIKEKATEADILIVTHYHNDHIEPKELQIYSGKKVFLKHPKRLINRSQKERAASILAQLRGVADEIKYADGRSFDLGAANISFSKPVPHGMTAARGYVIEVSITGDQSFLFTSDVQGPVLDEQVEFILREKPDVAFVDGPTTYIDSPYLPIELREANENLVKMIREAGIRRLVVDHHLTRDLDYSERIRPVYEAGDELGVVVECAAEYLKVEPNLLEARRGDLYQTSGGDRDVGR